MLSQVYIRKVKKLKGHDYRTIYKQAFFLYKKISSKTKRKPYIRSKYFGKEKIFLDYFWQHIHEKNINDKLRRLKFYECGLDLIRHNLRDPFSSKQNPNKLSERLYKFEGMTELEEFFVVQIKEDKNRQKHFISVFPE